MIDWGAHANNIDYVTSETVDLDKAIGVAIDFANNNGKTLVVVTADHETGGLVLIDGNIAERKVTASFATTDHSGTMVPIFSLMALELSAFRVFTIIHSLLTNF